MIEVAAPIKFPASIHKYLSHFQDDPPSPRLANIYAERALASFNVMRPVLKRWFGPGDQRAANLLDIGCGLGLIDIYLARMFAFNHICLIDGPGVEPEVDRIREKYHSNQQAWNCVQQAVDLLTENTTADISGFTPETANNLHTLGNTKFELIVSLRSWGHHYPVDNYLDLVTDSLTPEGMIILDIRNGTNGEAKLLAAGFRRLAQLPDASKKCERLAFVWRD